MGLGFCRGFALAILFVSVVGVSGQSGTCARASAVYLILPPPRDSCSPDESPAEWFESVGVVEGDEAALLWALNVVYKNREAYVAVLFHASWCPFSEICRRNLDVMSSLFPAIGHFAFEESVIRPSVHSRYGVHGFPTLFLLNSTMRVRYHGPRTVASLVAFYSDVTGIKPASLRPTPVDKLASLPKLEATTDQKSWPSSQARSPEELLRQYTYLALASFFVLLRLLYFLVPKLNSCVERAWRRQMQYTSLLSFWGHLQAYLDEASRGLNRLNPCKRSNLQEGAMNAELWASKSLASVSIGEPGSSRRNSAC